MRDALERLEGLAEPALWAGLAYLAGHGIEHDADELYAAFPRAELLLATGGDPRREVELSDRAVETVADDLSTPQHRARISARLAELELLAEDLPAVRDGLRTLGADPELAWLAYAWVKLVEHIAWEEEA